MKNDGHGPVIVAVAATNEPHLKLKDHPVEMVNINGKDLIRVPMLFAGVFSHPKGKNGKFNFTPQFLSRVEKNHNQEVWDSAPYFRVGHARDRALGWFDKQKGGYFSLEDNGKLLVGYAMPTDEEAIEIINKGLFRYASVDLHFNFKSRLMALLEISTHELEEYTSMTDQNDGQENSTNDLATLVALATQSAKDIAELNASITGLATRIETLETSEQEDSEEDTHSLEVQELKDVQLALQNENRAYKVALIRTKVKGVLAQLKAYRTSDNKGYSAALLNSVEAILLHKEITLSDETKISLESDEPTSWELASYFNDALTELVLHILPKSLVKLETETEGDDIQELDNTNLETKDADYKEFWKQQRLEI